MKKKIEFTCTHCGGALDQSIFTHQIEGEMKKKFQDDLVQAEKAMREKLKAELSDQSSEAQLVLQSELKEKSEKLKEMMKVKAEMEKLKREKDEIQEKADLKLQEMLSLSLAQEKEKLQKVAEEKSDLKIRELQKKLEDQMKLTEEMKRRQEQGSVQLQGEVQELLIEEFLRGQFNLDTITEVKKGARGADCLQTVNTRNKANVGSIYYESKRTKDFSPAWIQKFKADMRDKGAQFGILVTEARPAGIDRITQIEGVWVVSLEEFKGLCHVLRETVIKLDESVSSQVNRGDKKELMYQFLTSDVFRSQVETIVESFSQMQSDLLSEKRAIETSWKKREKMIERVLSSTIEMYGSFVGFQIKRLNRSLPSRWLNRRTI